MFVFAMCSLAAVAAYAGDVANPRCDWTLDGYVCAGSDMADAGEFTARRL